MLQARLINEQTHEKNTTYSSPLTETHNSSYNPCFLTKCNGSSNTPYVSMVRHKSKYTCDVHIFRQLTMLSRLYFQISRYIKPTCHANTMKWIRKYF